MAILRDCFLGEYYRASETGEQVRALKKAEKERLKAAQGAVKSVVLKGRNSVKYREIGDFGIGFQE